MAALRRSVTSPSLFRVTCNYSSVAPDSLLACLLLIREISNGKKSTNLSFNRLHTITFSFFLIEPYIHPRTGLAQTTLLPLLEQIWNGSPWYYLFVIAVVCIVGVKQNHKQDWSRKITLQRNSSQTGSFPAPLPQLWPLLIWICTPL